MWTGRQALNIGLVDHIGGLNKALKIAANLANLPANVGSAAPVGSFRVQTFKEPKSGLPFPFGSASASANGRAATDILAVCDDSIACSGLVSSETLGISPIFEILGLNRLFAYNVAYTSVGDAFVKAIQSFLSTSKVASNNWISEIFQDFL